MVDMSSEVLTVLEETESFLTFPDVPELSARSIPLLERYPPALGRVYAWQSQMRTSSTRPLYWAKTSTLSHPDKAENMENVFPMVLEFQSLNYAIAFAFSWAVLLQIYCSLIRILELIQSHSPDPSKLQDSQQNTYQTPSPIQENQTTPFTSRPSLATCIYEANRLARLIAQTLEYCHKLEMGMLGPQATTYPQWIIRRYFKFHPNHEREFKWCCEFKNMKGPGHRSGVETMMFSDNILARPLSA
jgi:hypothetical protein